MTARTLVQLRTAVRDRVHVSAIDPRFNDNVVNRSIQQAYDEVCTSQPKGWWFQRQELTFQVTTGDAAVVPINLDHTSAPDRSRNIQQLGYCFVSLDGNYWVPVRRRSRTDALRSSGGVLAPLDVPVSWGVQRLPASGGQRNQLAVVFDPPLPNLSWVRVGAVVANSQFINDTDQMVDLPAQFYGAVTERASSRLVRVRREVGNLIGRRRYITAATLCDTSYQGWMVALKKWWDKPYTGSGYGLQHWRS